MSGSIAAFFDLDRTLLSINSGLASLPRRAWRRSRSLVLLRDSLSDLPMLERVGEPRVVASDPRLRREARRRGWPILQW